LILGVGDLAASQGMPIQDIGSAGPYPGDIWHYARSKMIIAARANGLAAIDGPFADFRDLEGYRREAEWAASLGASGKWAIHPAQIDVANEVFGTKRKEIERARRVIDAVEAAEREGLGATAVDGVMADAASLRICRAILERAELEHQRIGALVEGEAR
jgi:citrate lyase subunit beta/citryl-CoA lyase